MLTRSRDMLKAVPLCKIIFPQNKTLLHRNPECFRSLYLSRHTNTAGQMPPFIVVSGAL